MRLSPFGLGGMVVTLLIAWVTLGGTVPPGEVTPDAALVGTYWRAVEIDDNPVTLQPQPREPHFVLAAHGNRVRGFTGCNQLTGSFEPTADGFRFRQLATTRQACPPPASALETAFLFALEATVTHHISGDTLALKDAGGRVRIRLVACYLR